LWNKAHFGTLQRAQLLNEAERCCGGERQKLHVEYQRCSEVRLIVRGCELCGRRSRAVER
jgi:hypothetical protein